MPVDQRGIERTRKSRARRKMGFAVHQHGIRAPKFSANFFRVTLRSGPEDYRRGGKALSAVPHQRGQCDKMRRLVGKKTVQQNDDPVSAARQSLHQLEIANVSTRSDFVVEKYPCDVHDACASSLTPVQFASATPEASAMKHFASIFGFVKAFRAGLWILFFQESAYFAKSRHIEIATIAEHVSIESIGDVALKPDVEAQDASVAKPINREVTNTLEELIVGY